MLIFRAWIASWAESHGQSYWLYIYVVDMATIALFAHAFSTRWVLANFVIDSFAGFCWWDISDRIFFNTHHFTIEDAITLGVFAITLGYKAKKEWK